MVRPLPGLNDMHHRMSHASRRTTAVLPWSRIKMMEMMQQNMRACRVCALFPVTFGALLFFLGYYLDPEITRILWLVFTGFMALAGIFMYLMARDLSR